MLLNKVDVLENRLSRNNLQSVGILEKAKGPDSRYFLKHGCEIHLELQLSLCTLLESRLMEIRGRVGVTCSIQLFSPNKQILRCKSANRYGDEAIHTRTLYNLGTGETYTAPQYIPNLSV